MTNAPRMDVWPPLPLAPYARRPSTKLPFPLEEPGCRIFSRARQGLHAGVKALGLRPKDEILVPAYHHGSEVEALVRAGLVCRFYDLGEDSEEERLEALLGERVKGLYLTHYLGVPQDAARWRAWCDERGLLLIEDAAQAWLGSFDGTPVGSHGDLAIFCLYKTFGLPDGAAVISNAPLPPPGDERSPGLKHAALGHASYLTQKWGWLAEVRRKRARPSAEYDPEKDFDLGDPAEPPTAMTSLLLPRVADEKARARRFSNYAFLLDRLGRFTPEAFSRPPEGASPFAFPVRVENKEDFISRLSRRGVVALNFWLVPHPALPAGGYPRAKELRESVVGLPVHQELGVGELERIVEAAADSL